MPALDRKAARSARTQRRLLRAARRLFSARGYDATPAELVAEHAGVTRAALYYHFRDKRVLFRAVCEEMESACVADIARAAAQRSEFWDQVDAAARATLDAFLDPAYVRLVFREGPAVLGWEEWHEIVGRFGRNQLRAGLEVAMDEGRIPKRPAAALARVITGAINEAGLAIAHSEDSKQARVEYGAVIDAVLEGLLRPPAD
jgi:AcrR family transcriptional regulator